MGSNPRNHQAAAALVAYVESLFMPWNVDALVAGFTEDCVVRFGTVPEFRGRAALRNFFEARQARQRDYRLTKRLRALSGDMLTNVWEGTWQDTETGRAMIGFGVEVWVMRDGLVAVWEAAFNTAPADAVAGIGRMLG